MLREKKYYSGKKVIVRVDYNVPMKDSVIIDDNRIKESIKTIKYLIDSDAKVILMSHHGKIDTEEDKKENSLRPCVSILEKYLNTHVYFSEETRGCYLENKISNLQNKEVLLIENTRNEDLNNKLESKCDDILSKYWASLGDLFIIDAFGSIHRHHASTFGISEYLPTDTGFLVDKELKILDEIKSENNKTIILGGAKVEDKIGIIKNLILSSENILLGGKMCFTFLKANGQKIGKSEYENSMINECKKMLLNDKVVLPVDLNGENGIESIDKIDENFIGYDIGDKTIEKYKQILLSSNMVVWNGTLGFFENEKYEKGTKEILEFLYNNKIKTIILGGDTASAVKKYGLSFYYISTGGGSSLEYLSGKEFEILKNVDK